MKYGLLIQSTEGVTVADINTGSVELVSYAEKTARHELKDSDNEFRVELTQYGADGAGEGVSLLKLTADGSTVADVLKVRLSGARKAERATAPETDANETDEI